MERAREPILHRVLSRVAVACPGLQELVDWVTPIQQRHFEQTLEGSLELAADEDPNEPA